MTSPSPSCASPRWSDSPFRPRSEWCTSNTSRRGLTSRPSATATASQRSRVHPRGRFVPMRRCHRLGGRDMCEGEQAPADSVPPHRATIGPRRFLYGVRCRHVAADMRAAACSIPFGSARGSEPIIRAHRVQHDRSRLASGRSRSWSRTGSRTSRLLVGSGSRPPRSRRTFKEFNHAWV
jgi:hypothetical protein